jgi:hypothetical protein
MNQGFVSPSFTRNLLPSNPAGKRLGVKDEGLALLCCRASQIFKSEPAQNESL